MQIISKICLMKKEIIIERTFCKQTTCHPKYYCLTFYMGYIILFCALKKDFLLQNSLLCLISHETHTHTKYIIEYTDS